jgi:hypothetical protein
MLAGMRTWWANKQNGWMRQRIAAGAHTLGKRSLFILPTRQGLYLGFFLLAMLLACINYNLSLGYMLTFFVFSVAMGAMHRTHQNLLGVRVDTLGVDPVFAGETIALPLKLSNPTTLTKFAITLTQRKPGKSQLNAPFDTIQTRIATKADSSLRLDLPALPRGVHDAPALEISSSYPLGLWRAWSYVFPIERITVYPEPKSPLPHLLPLPQNTTASTVQMASQRDTQGDAVSHIEAAQTAATRSIHWPSLAKGQLAQRILDNDTPLAQGVLLSLEGCTVPGIEAQLSQLCFAIQHCEAGHVPFVLQLNGVRFPNDGEASLSPSHIAQCLQALAAYD